MKKFRQYHIQVWFLDDDLEKSAEMLTDSFLEKSIRGCEQALLSSYLYFVGIRNKKSHKFYFSKDRKDDTLDRLFPFWPYVKPPVFTSYGTKFSKWTRMCKEHNDYVKQYLEILLDEYEYRKYREHSSRKFYEWYTCDAPKIKIPEAHLKKIVVEWKSLNPKYRKKDIVEGYKLQYKAIIDNFGGPRIGDFSNRDIPLFLLPEETQADSTIGQFME